MKPDAAIADFATVSALVATATAHTRSVRDEATDYGAGLNARGLPTMLHSNRIASCLGGAIRVLPT